MENLDLKLLQDTAQVEAWEVSCCRFFKPLLTCQRHHSNARHLSGLSQDLVHNAGVRQQRLIVWRVGRYWRGAFPLVDWGPRRNDVLDKVGGDERVIPIQNDHRVVSIEGRRQRIPECRC